MSLYYSPVANNGYSGTSNGFSTISIIVVIILGASFVFSYFVVHFNINKKSIYPKLHTNNKIYGMNSKNKSV